MSKTNWKSVDGYEGKYEVSDGGQVRSLARLSENGRQLTSRLMTLPPMSRDRKCISLRKGGKQLRRKVHLLVIETFAGARPIGHECRHLDGNVRNNAIANLAWLPVTKGRRAGVVK